MLIKTHARRAGGSNHEIGGKTYLFAPLEKDGPHVADVTIPAHVQRFLSIDGFTLYDPEADAAAAEAAIVEAVIAPAEPVDPDATVTNPGTPDPVTPDAATEDAPVVPLEDMSREDLVEIYEEVLGTKPHYRASPETLIARIREAVAATPGEGN